MKYHQLILMTMCLFSKDITWKYGWCVLWNHRYDKKLPTGRKVLKNVPYVTVTPETSIIAFGPNDKHYEGKNKRNLVAVIQLVTSMTYAWTTAQTHRTHHFTTLNQQKAQYSSLDTYIIISHWIFPHVSIHKGSSSGNPTTVIAHKTKLVTFIHSWHGVKVSNR